MFDLRELRVGFDGACADNGRADAVASYGWHVTDAETGGLVAEGSGRCVGVQTNNVAEYAGLVAALEWVGCLARRPDRLLIRGDSRLVIETLCGRWRCKKPHLVELRDRAVRLLKRLGCEWDAEWIPRAHNAKADSLSRAGATSEATL